MLVTANVYFDVFVHVVEVVTVCNVIINMSIQPCNCDSFVLQLKLKWRCGPVVSVSDMYSVDCLVT